VWHSPVSVCVGAWVGARRACVRGIVLPRACHTRVRRRGTVCGGAAWACLNHSRARARWRMRPEHLHAVVSLVLPCTARLQGYGHLQVCVERELPAPEGGHLTFRGPRTQDTEPRTTEPQNTEPRTTEPQNTEPRTQNTERERAEGRCAPLSPTEHRTQNTERRTQNTEPRRPLGRQRWC